MRAEVLSWCRREALFSPGAQVVCAVSGGADSTALAHWLLGRLGPERLVLAHVNHQLRGEESDRDEATARAFAQRAGQREWLQIIPYRDEYEEMPQFGTVRRLYWEV